MDNFFVIKNREYIYSGETNIIMMKIRSAKVMNEQYLIGQNVMQFDTYFGDDKEFWFIATF